jgi:hypothetical protein
MRGWKLRSDVNLVMGHKAKKCIKQVGVKQGLLLHAMKWYLEP